MAKNPVQTRNVTITADQIVVDRQALLDIVRGLDCGLTTCRLPGALDLLREPFFQDEISSGQARTDFTRNTYT